MTKKNIVKYSLKAKRIFLLAFSFLFLTLIVKGQVNHVVNGGFEQLDSCSIYMQNNTIWNYVPISLCERWDTLKNGGGGGLVMHECFNPNPSSGVPYNLYGGGYQKPRTGNAYSYFIFFKLTPNPAVNWRNYIQQKMLHKLIAGKSYCVTYWVSLVNYVNYGVDELGAYFDDGNIQSIAPLKEAPANPQVKSQSNVFYMDTLNWMKVQGTFIANGSEEYISLGNFRYTAATTYTALDGNWTAGLCNYFVDDVSVIETDLPAFAGADVWAIPTSSVYLGRASEVGLDDDCFWYKLPNSTTPIDTAAGITITVAATTETYMVKQDICGHVKYDTVVVYASGVGLNKREILLNRINLYPNPTSDKLNIELHNKDLINCHYELKIINSLGEIVIKDIGRFKNDIITINTNNIQNGIYTVNINIDKEYDLNKSIVIFNNE